jgi:S1-C subfamily serine protease
VLAAWKAKAEPSSMATIFARVKPSLAIIQNSDSVGTGFCISSSGTSSYYLTNAHVVGSDLTVTVYRQFPNFHKYTGTVVAEGVEQDPDLAIVRVAAANIPALPMQLTLPNEGDPVATVGYPSAQYNLGIISGEITPSVHIGTVSAIVNRGGLIEYDAQTLPGNSGGPLLDARTGNVVGIVRSKIRESTDANLAIGIGRIVVPFLKLKEISFVTANDNGIGTNTVTTSAFPSTVTLRTLPGANKVLIAYNTSGSYGGGDQIIVGSAQDFATKFAARFHVSAYTAEEDETTLPELLDAAHSHDALIVIPYGAGFHTISSYANQHGHTERWAFDLKINVIDTYGFHWIHAEKSKNAMSSRDSYDAGVSSFADLNDQVISEIDNSIQKWSNGTDESVGLNFFRYALPIGNGGTKAFVGFTPMRKGARASVAPFSPAADAGLQTGDIVESINGKSLVGKSSEELLALVRAEDASGNLDLIIIAPDGKAQHIIFQPKDLRWYVEHRAANAQ